MAKRFPLLGLRHRLGEGGLFARRQLAGLLPRGRMRILFSRKDDWEPDIRHGFRHSRHRLAFESIADATLEDYDLIVPLTIADLRDLDRSRHRLAHNPLPVPDWHSVNLCNDKYLLNLKLICEGFGEAVPAMARTLPYPHLLKKRIDAWGLNSHVVRDQSHEMRLLRDLDEDDYFHQQIVPGRIEYATHVLFRDGAVIHSLTIAYAFATEVFIRGKHYGESAREVVPCGAHLPMFAAILRAIGFEGLCCFNFKLQDGKPRIFEINPRFGASLSGHFMDFLPHIVASARCRPPHPSATASICLSSACTAAALASSYANVASSM